jgi:hypothetical protein
VNLIEISKPHYHFPPLNYYQLMNLIYHYYHQTFKNTIIDYINLNSFQWCCFVREQTKLFFYPSFLWKMSCFAILFCLLSIILLVKCQGDALTVGVSK